MMQRQQKKLLMLGGSYFQLPIIKCAKEAGHYVIVCDYNPNNPGRELADEYHEVSVIDRDAVLNVAKSAEIDGILVYAFDPAAPVVAYVAENLNLPTNPYESVMILARKDLFRAFLTEHGFNVPQSSSFYNLDEAKKFFAQIKKPVMVKPVDNAGSKGVRKISDISELESAFNYALSYSTEKKVVVEEFIQRVGYQIDGDGFVVDGKLVFTGFADQHIDKYCNPYVPVGESVPSIQPEEFQQKARGEIQRALTLLNWRNGALNIEYIVDEHGDIYILEIGPRNGGNLIPDMLKLATGVDLIQYTVNAALGLDCSSLKMEKPQGCYSTYIVHATSSGVLKEIVFADEIRSNIVYYQGFVQPGSYVEKFDGSDRTLGAMILKFSSIDEMLGKIDNMGSYIQVITK
jgi:biotin carboxylase